MAVSRLAQPHAKLHVRAEFPATPPSWTGLVGGLLLRGAFFPLVFVFPPRGVGIVRHHRSRDRRRVQAGIHPLELIEPCDWKSRREDGKESEFRGNRNFSLILGASSGTETYGHPAGHLLGPLRNRVSYWCGREG